MFSVLVKVVIPGKCLWRCLLMYRTYDREDSLILALSQAQDGSERPREGRRINPVNGDDSVTYETYDH